MVARWAQDIPQARYADVHPALQFVRFVHLRPSRGRQALHTVVASGEQYRAERVDEDVHARVQLPGLVAAPFRDDADTFSYFEVDRSPKGKGEVGNEGKKRGNGECENTS